MILNNLKILQNLLKIYFHIFFYQMSASDHFLFFALVSLAAAVSLVAAVSLAAAAPFLLVFVLII